MKPKISVCRKRDHVYLKFMGNFNFTSSDQLLHALRKMVMSSLEYSHPGSKVLFTFKTHARVNLEKELAKTEIGRMDAGSRSPELAPLTPEKVKNCGSDSRWG